jgi:UDP-glucose 4-epimerase
VWLITGGAGYIGSHIVRTFSAQNLEVVVADDLSSGDKFRIPSHVKLEIGDITSTEFISHLFQSYNFSGIINLAGLKSVSASEKFPSRYEEVNISGVQNLINAMTDRQIFIQSSTAAVYGIENSGLVSEEDICNPISVYGKTKLEAERILNNAKSRGIRSVSLRYFNVLGAANKSLVDKSGDNLVPLVLKAIRSNQRPQIFGDQYPTEDGTCIRDYVHVLDVARAHVMAAEALARTDLPQILNIGSGYGYSVRQVIDEILQQTLSSTEPQISPPRKGDPAMLVAKVEKARESLGFAAEFVLPAMISSSL